MTGWLGYGEYHMCDQDQSGPDAMKPRMIPVDLLIEYLHACAPVVTRVSDQIRPHDPLSTAVMPLVAAVTVLKQSVRRYRRHGTWDGTPVFLTATAPAPPRPPQDGPPLLPPWAAEYLR